MLSRKLTLALIATAALLSASCSVNRKASSDVRWKMSDVRSDTVREQVMVTVFDTITVTKTITIRENEAGDTVRVSTVTERDHVRDRSQSKVKSEKLKVERDTVYIEREADKTVAAVGTNTEIDEQGNIRHQPSYIRLLKWLFLTILAVIALIILIRIKH